MRDLGAVLEHDEPLPHRPAIGRSDRHRRQLRAGALA
jgi:hypothetical protein